jgi:hypothetical protein
MHKKIKNSRICEFFYRLYLCSIGLYVAHRFNAQFQGIWWNWAMEWRCNRCNGNFTARNYQEAEVKLKDLRERMGC